MNPATEQLDKARRAARAWTAAQPDVTIAHVPEWRDPMWEADMPSREGWLVECAVCGPLKDYAYAEKRAARSVRTRHLARWHDPLKAALDPELPAEVAVAYAELDALLAGGAVLPEQWDRAVSLPAAEEVAEALALMMPLESAPVIVLARKVVEVMARRRAPSGYLAGETCG